MGRELAAAARESSATPKRTLTTTDIEGNALSADQQNLVTVAERSTEAEAAILVSVLQDEGIRAVATGGFTAGFRAEAPGWVAVKTFEQDAGRARQIIAELMSNRVDED